MTAPSAEKENEGYAPHGSMVKAGGTDEICQNRIYWRRERTASTPSSCNRVPSEADGEKWTLVDECVSSGSGSDWIWMELWCLSASNMDQALDDEEKLTNITLLNDPAIAAELQAYVRSNKWAVDPEKLQQFRQNKLVPDAVQEYLSQITRVEMPTSLQNYMQLELFPQIHLKAG